MERRCSRCNKKLNKYHTGPLCYPCQENKVKNPLSGQSLIDQMGHAPRTPKGTPRPLPLPLPDEHVFMWTRKKYEFVPAEKLDLSQLRERLYQEKKLNPDAPFWASFPSSSSRVFDRLLKEMFSLGALRAKPAKAEHYEPMKHDLVEPFTSIRVDDTETILKFANSWGLLGLFGSNPVIEPISYWVGNVLQIQEVMRWHEAYLNRDMTYLRLRFKQAATRFNKNDDDFFLFWADANVAYEVNDRLKNRVNLVLHGKGRLQRGYNCLALIDAIWLQLHLHLTDPDRTLRLCANEKCKRPFFAEGKRKYHDTNCENAQTQREFRAFKAFVKSRGFAFDRLSKKKRKELKAEFKRLKEEGKEKK